jgi:hypothetical protein
MPPIFKEDQTSKMKFITAFFDDFDKKAAYLEEFYKLGHRDEARILCSCYLDSLASALYWPDERTNYNYVKCLIEHGGKEIFTHIHLKMLDEAICKLSRRGGKWTTIYASVTGSLQGGGRRFFAEQEIIDFLMPLLTIEEMEAVRPELWRGSFGAIIYDRFRVASVHGFGSPDATTFDDTTFQDQPVPAIDFIMVHNCLTKIIGVVRELSERTGKWFGHDFE